MLSRADLRPPSRGVRLVRVGAAFPTRLGFLRVLTCRLGDEGARLSRPHWRIDAKGDGEAVDGIALGGHTYGLVAASRHLPDDMRTTAVYGNGKFGTADRHLIEDRPGIEGPFAAEMLTVSLFRSFTQDLVEHPGGRPIAPHLKRHLGIGNSTGLGMAPCLVSHPVLVNTWMAARETALACRAAAHLSEWQVPAPAHHARIETLRAFRAARPDHALAPTRVALRARHPYAGVREKLIADICLPIDMLQCKLAFFGATVAAPKSDRWTRIMLAQGAPLPEDPGTPRADDWWLRGLAE